MAQAESHKLDALFSPEQESSWTGGEEPSTAGRGYRQRLGSSSSAVKGAQHQPPCSAESHPWENGSKRFVCGKGRPWHVPGEQLAGEGRELLSLRRMERSLHA